jgi:ribosome maturation factor RimP
VDEPLKLLRQYKKNIGRDVEVTMNDDEKKEGKLIAVTEEIITIEYTEGKGKKAIVKTEEIPFDTIKQTKIQIKF